MALNSRLHGHPWPVQPWPDVVAAKVRPVRRAAAIPAAVAAAQASVWSGGLGPSFLPMERSTLRGLRPLRAIRYRAQETGSEGAARANEPPAILTPPYTTHT